MPESDVTGGNAFIKRVYAAKSVDETQEAYDEWAETYDKDMVDAGYVAPALVAAQAVKLIGVDEPILDAGSCTGGVGVELAKLGVKTIDGVDLSPGMLEVAYRSSAYRLLKTADLSRRLDIDDGTYGAVVCCGTLTQGHVGPEALAEFVRIVRPGGVVVATILEQVWEGVGYKAEVERLEKDGVVEVISSETHHYRRSANTFARIVVLKKAS